MSENGEGATGEAINPHDWKAARQANPERFVTYQVALTHELAGYVSERLNRVMAEEIKSGVRLNERKEEDKEEPFERAHKAFSAGYHLNIEKFGTQLSEYQISLVSSIIRKQEAGGSDEDIQEANRKILELEARFKAAQPQQEKDDSEQKTPAPSLGAVLKRWGDKFSKSKETPYD